MKNKKQAIVVNIIGGPGVGKSILVAEIFAALKRQYVSCDMSLEYIKRKIREKAIKVTENQVYLYAKQQFQIYTMKDDVDVIVTDSPAMLCAVYDKEQCSMLKGLALKELNSYNNMTYFIERDKSKDYEQEGRYQDLQGAKKVDKKVKKFLDENKIEYKSINGIGPDVLELVVSDVLKKLGKKNASR